MFLSKVIARRSSQDVLNDLSQDQLKKMALTTDPAKVDPWKRREALYRITDKDFLLALLAKSKKDGGLRDHLIEVLLATDGRHVGGRPRSPMVSDPKLLAEMGAVYGGGGYYRHHDGNPGNPVLDKIQKLYPKDKWQALLKRWAKDATSRNTREFATLHVGSAQQLKELAVNTNNDEIQLALVKQIDDPETLKRVLEGNNTRHQAAELAALKIKGDEEFFKKLLVSKKKDYYRSYSVSSLVQYIKDQDFLLKLATTSDDQPIVKAAIKKLGPKRLKELYFQIGVPKKGQEAARGWDSKQWNQVKEQILEGNKDDQQFIYDVVLKDPKDSFRKEAVKFLTDEKLITDLLNRPRLKQDVRYLLIKRTNDPAQHRRFALDDPSVDVRKLAIERPHKDQTLYLEYLKRHSRDHDNWRSRDLFRHITDPAVLEKIASEPSIADRPRHEAFDKLDLAAKQRVYDKVGDSPAKTELLHSILRHLPDEVEDPEQDLREKGDVKKTLESWVKQQLESETSQQRQYDLVGSIRDQPWLADFALKHQNLTKKTRERLYHKILEPEPSLLLARQEQDPELRGDLYRHLDTAGASALLEEGFEHTPDLRIALMRHLTAQQLEPLIDNEDDSSVLQYMLTSGQITPAAVQKIADKIKDRESIEHALVVTPPETMTEKAGAEWWAAFGRAHDEYGQGRRGGATLPQKVIDHVYRWLPPDGIEQFARKISPPLAAQVLPSMKDPEVKFSLYRAIAPDQRLLGECILKDTEVTSARMAANLVTDTRTADLIANTTDDDPLRARVLMKISPATLKAEWVDDLMTAVKWASTHRDETKINGPLAFQAYQLAVDPDTKRFFAAMLPGRMLPEKDRKAPVFDKAKGGGPKGDAKPVPTNIPAPRQQLLRLLLRHARP